MNCFTWNDIDTALIACFEKSCKAYTNMRTIITKIGEQYNFKIYGIGQCQPCIISEKKKFLNLYISAFA